MTSKKNKKYRESFESNERNTLRLFMVGVSKHYEGMNIATRLIEENLKLAKQKYFSCAIGEARGSVTQHILRDKLGFNEKCAFEFKSYTCKGKHVFKNIKNPSRCILLEKRLY